MTTRDQLGGKMALLTPEDLQLKVRMCAHKVHPVHNKTMYVGVSSRDFITLYCRRTL